jgi:hypothetical protein
MGSMRYEQVADEAGLISGRKELYANYMRTRWGDTEEQKCSDGYAAEWATRFLQGREYQASDWIGQRILDRLQGRGPQ